MKITKTTGLALTLFVIASLTFSCNQSNIKNSKNLNSEMSKVQNTPNYSDTIPLDTFYRWVNTWDNQGQLFTQNTLIKYFTLDKDDLVNVLSENIDSARFYLGLDSLTASPTPHLMVVGVNKKGKDMLDYSAGEYVYDVSRPCPPMCGNN